MKRYSFISGKVFILTIVVVLSSCGGQRSSGYGDWYSNYEKSDANAYGDKLFYDLIVGIFDSLTFTRKPIEENFVYDYYKETYSTDLHNLIFVTGTLETEDDELTHLLNHVNEGYDVFIAASYFEEDIMKALSLEWNYGFEDDSTSADFQILADQKVEMTLINSNGEMLDFSYKSYLSPSYFSVFDNENIEVLSRLENGQPNTVRIYYGEGSFILSTTPVMFTNYGTLHNQNHVYVACILSLMSKEVPVTWDEFYKPFASKDRGKGNNDGYDGSDYERPETKSDLDFILRNPPLAWAFYLTLLAFAIYMILGGKRKQRIIPPWDKKKNSSIEFANIISQLYYQRADHKDASDKLITFFLEYIRNSFYVKTSDLLEDNFLSKITIRSGVMEEEVTELFSVINKIRLQSKVSQSELMYLNKVLESFKEKSLV